MATGWGDHGGTQVLSVPRVMALTSWRGHCGGQGLQALVGSVWSPSKGLTGELLSRDQGCSSEGGQVSELNCCC